MAATVRADRREVELTQRALGLVFMVVFAVWCGSSLYLLYTSQAARSGVAVFFGLH